MSFCTYTIYYEMLVVRNGRDAAEKQIGTGMRDHAKLDF